jgi:hypothetical protein
MTIKRRVEETDAEGRTRVTVEEPTVTNEQHDAAVQERTDHVRTTGSAADLMRGTIRTLTAIVAVAIVALETLLLFRFVFLLTGANPSNNFVDFIYDASNWLVDPFEGIADPSTSGDGVFDPATVIAMAVVLAAGLLIMLALWAISTFPSPSTERTATSRSSYESQEARERDQTYH